LQRVQRPVGFGGDGQDLPQIVALFSGALLIAHLRPSSEAAPDRLKPDPAPLLQLGRAQFAFRHGALLVVE
jgi:hypothetical protein